MRTFCIAAMAALLALVAPAHAGKGKVALLPVRVYKGNPDNGPVITDALRASLEKQGFTVLPADQVQREVDAEKIDLSKPQSIMTVAALKKALGADYAVYPRVLGVGLAQNVQDPQATIIVNVVGTSAKSYLHTRQIGQVFKKTKSTPQAGSVIDRGSADEAATKLLEGFYARVK